MNIQDTLYNIVRDQFHLESSKGLNPATNFAEDLGADSLDHVEIIIASEQAFGIRIRDDQVENIETIGDAVEFVGTMLQPFADTA